jgi:hypothetical protein
LNAWLLYWLNSKPARHQPDDVHIVLHLDRAARRERDRRGAQAQLA